MHQMTRANLEAAFAGESQAHMRYLIFANQAEKEGYPEVARLFRAVAYAEQVHATNHFKALGGLGKTTENLKEGIGGETYEVDEMYPAFQAVAELQGEKTAARFMQWAYEAEKIHADTYTRVRGALEADEDPHIDPVYVCSVCGWTGEGEPPDECPLCKAKKEKFVTF
ncbi:MAG: rubrerythrin family protein [Anaerolineae bacterium]|nr:rubrerythrin family protein [Anaerolineae bacterium]